MSRILVILLLLIAPAAPRAYDVQSPQPPAHEGFVPVDQLPGEEKLPATPLVAAAYGVAWAAVLLYVWSLWRRLARVEREFSELARRIDKGAP